MALAASLSSLSIQAPLSDEEQDSAELSPDGMPDLSTLVDTLANDTSVEAYYPAIVESDGHPGRIIMMASGIIVTTSVLIALFFKIVDYICTQREAVSYDHHGNRILSLSDDDDGLDLRQPQESPPTACNNRSTNSIGRLKSHQKQHLKNNRHDEKLINCDKLLLPHSSAANFTTDDIICTCGDRDHEGHLIEAITAAGGEVNSEVTPVVPANNNDNYNDSRNNNKNDVKYSSDENDRQQQAIADILSEPEPVWYSLLVSNLNDATACNSNGDRRLMTTPAGDTLLLPNSSSQDSLPHPLVTTI